MEITDFSIESSELKTGITMLIFGTRLYIKLLLLFELIVAKNFFKYSFTFLI